MITITREDRGERSGVTGEGMVEPERPAVPTALPIVRSTVLLSASQAFHSAMHTLAVAVASITLVQVLDVAGLLGLGPAIVLAAGALAVLAGLVGVGRRRPIGRRGRGRGDTDG